MRQRRLIRMTFVAASFFILAITPVWAAPAPQPRDVKAELAASQSAQREAAEKAKKLAGEVSDIKKKLVSASRDLRVVEDELASSESKLNTLQRERSKILEHLYRDEDTFHNLLGAARRYEDTPTALMLLRNTPIESARASSIMKSILPELQHQSQQARQTLASLSTVEDLLSQQKEENKKKLSNYNKEKTKLDFLLEDRKKIYTQTEVERKAQEREVARLAKEAKSLEDLVAKIRQKPKFSTTPDADDDDEASSSSDAGAPLVAGLLPEKKSRFTLPSHIQQPVSGAVRIGFGEKDDLGALAKGVTFSTRANATVITPLAGTVRFAGPFQKYRHILIIEHRGGYHSLIAGLGHIDTVVGARLNAGEPVGSSESASPALIYFELRHNGKPINPQKLALSGFTTSKEKT